MLWDTHMHCSFSGDSDTSPDEMIASAIKKGLPGICFTDHLDYEFPSDPPDLFVLDPQNYYNEIMKLKACYANKLDIHAGIEIGVQPGLYEKLHQIVTKIPFDQVICSSHVVDGYDLYYKDFYIGKEEHAAYLRYFESIAETLDSFNDFDVYGHIDYVVRYGPNTNRFYSYGAYSDILDTILKKLIAMGKGIEINTGGFKYGLGHPNPNEEIIKRYHELGGEIITIGADAHAPEHVGYDFEKVPPLLREAGFSYYTVFKNRKPEFIPIP